MVDNETLDLGTNNILIDKHYSFSANISSFSGLRIGNGYNTYGADYIEIDNAKLYIYRNTHEIQKEIEHGLIFSNNIQIKIDVNEWRLATISVTSNGKTFTTSTNTWYGNRSNIYATSIGSELTNCILSFACDGYSKDLQFYGDSYLSQSSDRWLSFAFKDGYTNALFDGYAGKGSILAISSLKENLKYSNPKTVVWMLGMNDGSDPNSNTPNETWASTRDELISLSKKYNFELVFTTIPTVPNINHEGKNTWIRNSEYRYIDVALAVGADGTGQWTEGMLYTDNVHPSVKGSEAIFNQVIQDLPEFKQ